MRYKIIKGKHPKEKQMASILGFKLKNRTIYRGDDGQANQGDLWYKKQKIAWFNDSADGSPIDLEYNSREEKEKYQPILEAAIKEYYKRYPIEYKYGEIIPDEGMFMCELLALMDNEKSYKNMVKKGFPIVIMYTESANSPYTQIVGVKSEASAQNFISKNDITKYTMYKSIEDFDIK